MFQTFEYCGALRINKFKGLAMQHEKIAIFFAVNQVKFQ